MQRADIEAARDRVAVSRPLCQSHRRSILCLPHCFIHFLLYLAGVFRSCGLLWHDLEVVRNYTEAYVLNAVYTFTLSVISIARRYFEAVVRS